VPSIIKVDHIQSDSGTINIPNNIVVNANQLITLISASSAVPSVGFGINSAPDNSNERVNIFRRCDVHDPDTYGQVITQDWSANVAQIRVTHWSVANSTFTPLAIHTGGSVKLRIETDGQQSSVIPGVTGLYNEYKCRAWVNFNGTGTPAIRSSGNVSSITDHSAGNYSVNMTTAMPDANYAVTGTCSESEAGSRSVSLGFDSLNLTPTTTEFRINTRNFGIAADVDCPRVFVSVFR
jgi:hypothetical protein